MEQRLIRLQTSASDQILENKRFLVSQHAKMLIDDLGFLVTIDESYGKYKYLLDSLEEIKNEPQFKQQ